MKPFIRMSFVALLWPAFALAGPCFDLSKALQSQRSKFDRFFSCKFPKHPFYMALSDLGRIEGGEVCLTLSKDRATSIIAGKVDYMNYSGCKTTPSIFLVHHKANDVNSLKIVFPHLESGAKTVYSTGSKNEPNNTFYDPADDEQYVTQEKWLWKPLPQGRIFNIQKGHQNVLYDFPRVIFTNETAQWSFEEENSRFKVDQTFSGYEGPGLISSLLGDFGNQSWKVFDRNKLRLTPVGNKFSLTLAGTEIRTTNYGGFVCERVE